MALGGNHAILPLPQYQRGSCFALGQAGLDTEADQLLGVPDIHPFLKVALHDAILDLGLQSMPGGVGNQKVRAPAVRYSLDQIEAERDPDGPAVAQQSFLHGRHPGRIAYFSGQIAGTLHPLPRHIGIQLERTPGHARFIVRPLRQRQLEAPLTEETPWTYGVGIDIDSHVHGHYRDCTRPLMGFVANEYHP
ncbi:MAG: hypothetical protein JWN43_3047 [Gammaproteobacteria bacterium]|nr:hypothetical protein [Gammaproteobacteria bacterium]